MTEIECDRCGSIFPIDARHTEIVRRDFDGEPLPAKTEHLCADCLAEYETFLR